MTTPVRDHLVHALYADLVGLFQGGHAHATSKELIRSRPSERYLTGFLVPDKDREPEPDAATEDANEVTPPTEVPTLFAASLYETRAAFMVDTDLGLTKTYNALKDPTVTERSIRGERVVHLRGLHLQMDRAVVEACAAETGDPAWTNVEIPPFTDPETPAEKALHQDFEDHVLDKLFALNAERSRT